MTRPAGSLTLGAEPTPGVTVRPLHFMVPLLFAASPAWAEAPASACPASTTLDEFVVASNEAEAAFAALDAAGLNAAREKGMVALRCLSEPLTTREAAAFHRLMAYVAFTARDYDQVKAEFHASRRLEPGYMLPENVALPGTKLAVLYEESALSGEGELQPVMPPADGFVVVDGVRGAPRPSGISTIIQVFEAGVLKETVYLAPDVPLPSWGPTPVASMPRPGEMTETDPNLRVPLLVATGVSVLASGALYGLTWRTNQEFWDASTPDGELEGLMDRNNTLFWSATGAAGVAGALAVVTVVTW